MDDQGSFDPIFAEGRQYREGELPPIRRFKYTSPGLFATLCALERPGAEPPAQLNELWDGLEAFPAYGDEMEPAPLATACLDALGLAPDASGLVDHEKIGDEWERTGRAVSIIDALLRQLGG